MMLLFIRYVILIPTITLEAKKNNNYYFNTNVAIKKSVIGKHFRTISTVFS